MAQEGAREGVGRNGKAHRGFGGDLLLGIVEAEEGREGIRVPRPGGDRVHEVAVELEDLRACMGMLRRWA